MQVSAEIRRLTARHDTDTAWPQRLDWIQISGLRGWTGQRFEMRYPIMAVVGENGVGKSTIIQAAVSVFKSRKGKFASDYFPKTTWETEIPEISIRYGYRQGGKVGEGSLRKSSGRWKGNPQRPERNVAYIDLSRIQPISARVGYTRIVKSQHHETEAEIFDPARLERLSRIMGRGYKSARLAKTNIDRRRAVPVLGHHQTEFSGFNQGQGEITITELMQKEIPKYSLVVIDEMESSLHPRTQRRLVRYLADLCREREWQVIITTHSPYVLQELPEKARAYIMEIGNTREVIYGVSPEFAMTRMDDIAQPECDLYVEDERAQTMLTEILVEHSNEKDTVQRCDIIPYGASSVGKSLGQMVHHGRFKRPTRVFLDGDAGPAPGCLTLPGIDPPEIVVFSALAKDWTGVSDRVGRSVGEVADACDAAMLMGEHHDWITAAAMRLRLKGDTLWQAMCSQWSKGLDKAETKVIVQSVQDALIGLPFIAPTPPPSPVNEPPIPAVANYDSAATGKRRKAKAASSETGSLFDPSSDDALD